MNASIYRISLDIQDAYAKVALDAKRGDVGRQIRVTLTDGGVPYVISPECYVLFAATKPDGNKVLNICAVEDNTVIYKITEQTVAVIGTLQCEIQVFGSDNGHLTSACFDMNVHESAADADTASEDEMDVLAQLISDATDTIAKNKKVTEEAEIIVDELKESQEIRAMIGNLSNLDTEAKSSLVAAINELDGKTEPEEIDKIIAAYLEKNPPEETDPTVPEWAKQPEKPSYTAEEVGALSLDDLQTGIDQALEQAKESGLFDGEPGPKGDPFTYEDFTEEQLALLTGADGKSAYQYAQDGGYTGTEEEFAEKMASELGGADWNVSEGEPGHVMNRTHYTENAPNWLVEDATIITPNGITGASVDWINYATMQGCNLARVIFNGATYNCPVKWYTDPDMPGDSNCQIGNVWGSDPEIPFGIICFKGSEGYGTTSFMASKGTYTVSFAKMSEVVHKLDKKFIPDDVVGSGYPVPCVMDYGAVGDGATDDTVAFQTALAENGIVFVPGGVYVLSDTLTIGANCCFELSQDTVLQFTQTDKNCIQLGESSTLKGNHATVKVPYGFTEKVVYAHSADGTETSISIFRHWTPQWKSGRYVTDLNICKEQDDTGLHQSVNGECSGTAVYLSTDRVTGKLTYMWGIHFSGLRIAGAFSYGIRAVNFNDGWMHELRISDTLMDACEIGVSLEDCNNTYVSAIIQPRRDNSDNPYAKHGIQLIRSRNADLSGSRVWDWDGNYTLWTEGGEYQHISMIGDCSGAILNDFRFHGSGDTRKRIYTDTASNLDKLTILQEPITRWFKPKENEPYFFDGNGEKRLALKEEIDEYFQSDRIPGFTDALATAIDTDGSIYNGVGYKAGVVAGSTGGEGADPYYWSTGYIACKAGDTLRAQGLFLKSAFAANDGVAKIVYFDANFNRIWSATAETLNPANSPSNYYQAATETDDGFEIYMKPTLAERGTLAYVRLTLRIGEVGVDPVISINDEIKFTQSGFLADGIKVKGENVVGGTGGGVTSWNDLTDKPFGDLEEILPETVFQYDSRMGLFYMTGSIDFRYGETYVVKWNGVEYTATATIGYFTDPYYGTNTMPIVVLGNPAPLGAPEGVVVENNGLPFAIASVDYLGAVGAIPLDGSTAITISIYSTKKLDPYWYNGAYILNIETTDTEINSSTVQIPFTCDTTELAMAVLNNRPIHVHLRVAKTNNGVEIGQSSALIFATAISMMGGEGDLKQMILQCISLGLISTIPFLRIDSLYLGKPIYFYSDHAIG